MMDLLPPVGWADVATKHDLLELERRLDLRFEAVDHRFEAMEHRVIGELRREIVASTRTFVTWMIAVGAVMVTAVGAATGLLIAAV